MEHINQLIEKAQAKSGSTKNYSNEAISDPIRTVFSMFRANYKKLFENNYPNREALNKDMFLWQAQFGSIDSLKLRETALLCIAKYKFPPNIADFNKVLLENRSAACHRYAKPSLPKPPRTEAEKQEQKERIKNLRQAIQ